MSKVSGDASHGIPGFEAASFRAWVAREMPDVVGDVRASLVAGGKSNLTYAVDVGTAHQWIVRRPPLGHVLATAHDMNREFRVMSALRKTSVPVPRTIGLCRDQAVLGATFYVMERCPGTPYRRAEELEALGERRTRIISERLVDTLVSLHAVRPSEVGLADFGRPKGYLSRQVVRWGEQLEASSSRDLPEARELHRRLSRRVPQEGSTAVVHGDFRLDNILVDTDDTVTAVLDWEMATLGDPLSDLALMLTYHRLCGLPGAVAEVVSDASAAPGFITEREALERYSKANALDLTDISFHMGLAAFKLAVILEGIHYRHASGHTVGAGFESVGSSVRPLLELGLQALKEH